MSGSSLPYTARVPRLTRIALTVVIAVTGALATTGTAQADTQTNTIPGPRFCGFVVTETLVSDNAKTHTTPFGTVSTGHLVVTFTNPANGKSQTFNVSGATHDTVSGNTVTEVFTGPFFLIAGPTSRANTGLPAISVGTGRAVLTADSSTRIINSFSSTVPVTDVCALLA